MKSAHRHELETNVLAHRLENYIESYRPYIAKVLGGIVALVALLFVWSYVSGSSASRGNEAWDAYNMAISIQPPNLDLLRQTAEAYPGTNMQQMANVTWADGQLFAASRNYISNRTAATKALQDAAGAYSGVIQSSDDASLKGRATLGLARVYEMQNEIDKARAEYEKVTGPYAAYAKTQVERLSKPAAKESYAWLATAQAPIVKPPVGPGTPAQRPEFAPGDISLPNGGEGGAPKTGDAKAADTFDNLLKDMQKDSKAGETGDRYKADEAPATGTTPAAPGSSAVPATPSDAAPATASDEKAAK